MSNFFFTELILSIVWGIGVLVLREFIISKDGLLRKIMICYFAVEVYTYGGSALYFWFVHNHWTEMPMDTFRVIIITPKVFVKLWLLWYLKRGRNKIK